MYKKEKQLIGEELGHSNATNPHMIIVPKVGKKNIPKLAGLLLYLECLYWTFHTFLGQKHANYSKNYKARHLVIYPC